MYRALLRAQSPHHLANLRRPVLSGRLFSNCETYLQGIGLLFLPLFCIFSVVPSSAQLIYGVNAYEPAERSRLLTTLGFNSHRSAEAAQKRGDLASAWSGYQKILFLCGDALSERWRPVIANYSSEQLSLCASAYRNQGIVYLKANRAYHACVSFRDSIGFGDLSLRTWVSENCNPMPQVMRLPDWLFQHDATP